MAQSFLAVAGDEGADKRSPGNERRKRKRGEESKVKCKGKQWWLTVEISL